MKVEAFKKLIKESVREVLIEEGILNENRINQNFQNLNPSKYIMNEQFTTTPYNKGVQVTSTGDPLKDLMRQTMMNADDLSNFQ